MKVLHIVLSTLAIVGVVLTHAGVANAATNELSCEVYARSYSVGTDTITANFEVKKVGTADCTKDVTVAAWDAPNGVDGAPFNQQKFVDSKSGTFAPGNHSLTVKKPTCFYQVDLLRGLSPFGPQGTNDYQDWQYVSSAHGGEACKPAPQPVQPVAAGVGGPTQLPKTGPTDILAIGAVSGAAAGVAHNIRARRRSSN